MTLVLLDTNKYKDMIAGRMIRENGRGSWMVYDGCDMEYAQQVTAEHKITTRKNGPVRQEWVQKHTHGDNHYLDCEVYAMCAADILGVRTLHLKNEEITGRQDAPVATEKPTSEEQWIRAHDNWIQGG